MMAIGTMITRFLPFICFPDNKKIPKSIEYLGKTLPFAVMGFLVVYCLKEVSVTTRPFGIPEFISIVSILALHLWKKNTFISIFVGTAVYMILLRLVFV